jgi:beta-glucosidase
LGHRTVPILEVGKLKFKDLNKNGKLDPYEDWRLPNETRIQDLVSQMTLDEKAGMMLISTTRMAGDFAFEQGKPKDLSLMVLMRKIWFKISICLVANLCHIHCFRHQELLKGKEKHLRNFILRQYRRQNHSRMV